MAHGLVGQDISQNYSPILPLQHEHETGGGYYGIACKVTHTVTSCAQSSCSKKGSGWSSGVEFCATRFSARLYIQGNKGEFQRRKGMR
jgi:hypothetical protein